MTQAWIDAWTDVVAELDGYRKRSTTFVTNLSKICVIESTTRVNAEGEEVTTARKPRPHFLEIIDEIVCESMCLNCRTEILKQEDKHEDVARAT